VAHEQMLLFSIKEMLRDRNLVLFGTPRVSQGMFLVPIALIRNTRQTMD